MSAPCATCKKTVYDAEATQFAGKKFHKACFKCTDCGTSVTAGGAVDVGGNPKCKTCSQKAGTITNKSGGNYDSTVERTGGLDADAKVKADAKLAASASRFQDAANFINKTVAGANVPSDSAGFATSLQDGTTLMKLVNLKPGSTSGAMAQRDNISQFLTAAKALGANRASFQVVDLYEAKNLVAVVDCILDVQRALAGGGSAASVQVAAGGDICAKCNKKVFASEKKIGLGKTFHDACFKCVKCSAKLDSGAMEVKGQPYCAPCQKKSISTSSSPAGKNAVQGVDADLAAKQAAKFDVGRMNEAARYLSAKSGTPVPEDDQVAFAAALKDGMVLIQVAAAIDPSVKVPPKAPANAFAQRTLIGEFLGFLQKKRSATTFTTVDLYESQNLGQVVDTINYLAKTNP